MMDVIANKVFETLLVCILYPIYFIFSNGSIKHTLEDDVEFNCGKKMIRKVYKKKKFSFWQKFFFRPFRKKTKKHHYVLFLVNIATAPFCLLALIGYIWMGPQSWARLACIILFAIELLTSLFGGVIPYFWLYRGNKVRPRPPKQKKQDK